MASMNSCARIISEERIAGLSLHAKRLVDLEVVEQTGSTNADLLARLHTLDRPTFLLARTQTAGRGRAGRRWVSSPDGALTFSLAWRFRRPLHELMGLPLAVGLAVSVVLKRFSIDVQLKWPNDVLKNGRKLAGILMESAFSGRRNEPTWVVIGVGINLALAPEEEQQVDQPIAAIPELAAIDRPLLAAAMLDQLAETLAQFDQDGFAPFMERWNATHAYAGRRIDVLDGGQLLHHGTALGVNETGCLLLDTAAGVIPIVSGDVSLRLRQEE